jgi:hypothetical protein
MVGRRAEAPWIADPGTVTHHPSTAIARCSRTAISGVAHVAVVPAVLRPFKGVAVNIVKVPPVRIETVDGYRTPAAVAPGAATLEGSKGL